MTKRSYLSQQQQEGQDDIVKFGIAPGPSEQWPLVCMSCEAFGILVPSADKGAKNKYLPSWNMED